MRNFDKWISMATRDRPVDEVARLALDTRLAAVWHFLPLAAFLADEDIEYVHDARVATRRAAAALRLFVDLTPKKHRRRMRSMLKEIRGSMGDARDLDVYLDRFRQTHDEGAESLVARLQRERFAAQKPIVATATPLLDRQRLRRRIAKLVERTRTNANVKSKPLPFGPWAEQQTALEWRHFEQQVPGDHPTATELHQFRIAGKRLRYSLELLSGGLPQRFRAEVYPQVKQLQSQLGEIQDHAVAAQRLRQWQTQAENDAERSLLERLEQDEREQCDGKRAAFLHWWRRDRINELAACAHIG